MASQADIEKIVRQEIRGWRKDGVDPAAAARVRRDWARLFPKAADVHEAVAEKWEEIARLNPGCVAPSSN